MNFSEPIVQARHFAESLAAWSHFVTPTHRHAVTLDEAAAVLRRWAEALARDLGEHVHIFWCVEEGGMFGRAHSHALIAPWRRAFRIDADLLVRLWAADPSAGEIQVRQYIPRGGAAEYIMKADRFGFGLLCPRLNECRRRCLAGRRPFAR